MAQPPGVPFQIDGSLLGRIVQNFPSGSINLFDRELRFLFAGGRGLSALGLSRDQFVGKSLQDLFPKEIVDYVTPYLERALAGADVEFELCYQGHYYTISAAPLFDENREIHAVVSVATDITDYRRLETLRDDLLSLVAHDLKGPLTGIRNVAQSYMQRIHATGMQYDELMAGYLHIEVAVNDMLGQINRCLEDTRLRTSNLLVADIVPIDLVELAEVQVEKHRSISSAHQIELQAEGTRLIGNWDRQRLESMITNLLSNAIKFSPAGGAVRVRLTREDRVDGGWVVVTISDPGIGIPAADLIACSSAFTEPATRWGALRAPATVWRACEIVTQHGGTVAVQSQEDAVRPSGPPPASVGSSQPVSQEAAGACTGSPARSGSGIIARRGDKKLPRGPNGEANRSLVPEV